MKSRTWMTVGAAVFLAAAWMGASSCSQPAGGSEGGGTGTAWREPEPEQAPAGEREEQLQWYSEKLEECRTSEEFLGMLDQFSYRSASALLAGGESSANENYSPLSLYYALSILGTGASGETETEIMEALGVGDKAELADQCAKLYRRYAYTEEREKLLAEEYGEEASDSAIRLADSLWISDDIALRTAYQETCAEDFYTSSYHVDFKDPETAGKIGEWISQQTEGVLAPEPDLSSDTVLAIINTLYFYGGWQDRFSEEFTEEDTFTREDGSEVAEMILDRPFLFAVHDYRNDVWLFLGVCADPSME